MNIKFEEKCGVGFKLCNIWTIQAHTSKFMFYVLSMYINSNIIWSIKVINVIYA